jgi:hypothetical protein
MADPAAVIPWLDDSGEVIINGRHYVIAINEFDCTAVKHYHYDRHADGSLGNERHHHHSSRCADIPRQATLYPLDADERHEHEFGPGEQQPHTCTCGAWRERAAVRDGSSRNDGRMFAYHMPPDQDHPQGWSYKRRLREDE